jgi:hypothetical protein
LVIIGGVILGSGYGGIIVEERMIAPAYPRKKRAARSLVTMILGFEYPWSDTYCRDLEQVREISSAWLGLHNEERPHEAFGSMPPARFRAMIESKTMSTSDLSKKYLAVPPMALAA